MYAWFGKIGNDWAAALSSASGVLPRQDRNGMWPALNVRVHRLIYVIKRKGRKWSRLRLRTDVGLRRAGVLLLSCGAPGHCARPPNPKDVVAADPATV